jgi:hypothetical protein
MEQENHDLWGMAAMRRGNMSKIGPGSRGVAIFILVLMGSHVILSSSAMAMATPTIVQEHYRWRSDDGSETTATWKAAADTAISNVARGENIRLRFCVANTADDISGEVTARLEYAEATSGPWTAVGTDGVGAFETALSTRYANGATTTDLLSGSGSFVAGQMVEQPSRTSALIERSISGVRSPGTPTPHRERSTPTVHAPSPTPTPVVGRADR